MRSIVIPLLAAAALSACSTLSRPQKPQVDVVDLRPAGGTLFRQSFDVTLRMRNPNNQALRGEGIKFDLKLAGQPFAQGMTQQAISLPALGEQDLTVRVDTSLNGWLAVADRLLSRPQAALDYEVNGTAEGVQGWGSLPFSSRGQWTLPESLRKRLEAGHP